VKYTVNIVSDASEDLFDIYLHIAETDSPLKAERLIAELKESCTRLEKFPDRGHVPPELATLGISDYREIHHGPYRIIYQIVDRNVFVHGLLDGRRDLQDLLQIRLLRP